MIVVWTYTKSPREIDVDIPRTIEVPERPVREPEIALAIATTTKLGMPISDALRRITKKPFGIEVHPETSPVPNDKFDGYHVGVDFEIFDGEENIDVPIYAMCDGRLIYKNFAKGYGGIAVQACVLNEENVTVIYGHLDHASIEATTRTILKRGDTIGFLGKGYSTETDGERKHLHLGIHRGSNIDIRGYVKTLSDLGDWIDALPYLQP